MQSDRDVFLCHAFEDKEYLVHPLEGVLRSYGITYWLDEGEIKWGEGITRKVNEGLASSRYVVVLLTEAFLGKHFAQAELASALNKENSVGQVVVLPILAASENLVFERYPLLRDKRYLRWSAGVDTIVDELSRLLDREFKENWVFHFPGDYSGPVWTCLVAKGSGSTESHEVVLRWGPLQFEGSIVLNAESALSLRYTKGVYPQSIPVFLSVAPSVYAYSGIGEPPSASVLEINYGWRQVTYEPDISVVPTLPPEERIMDVVRMVDLWLRAHLQLIDTRIEYRLLKYASFSLAAEITLEDAEVRRVEVPVDFNWPEETLEEYVELLGRQLVLRMRKL